MVGVEEIVVFNIVPVPLKDEIEGGILAAIGTLIRTAVWDNHEARCIAHTCHASSRIIIGMLYL